MSASVGVYLIQLYQCTDMNQMSFVCQSDNQDSTDVSEKPVASISRKHISNIKEARTSVPLVPT